MHVIVHWLDLTYTSLTIHGLWLFLQYYITGHKISHTFPSYLYLRGHLLAELIYENLRDMRHSDFACMFDLIYQQFT